jgi:hypothetical protein
MLYGKSVIIVTTTRSSRVTRSALPGPVVTLPETLYTK